MLLHTLPHIETPGSVLDPGVLCCTPLSHTPLQAGTAFHIPFIRSGILRGTQNQSLPRGKPQKKPSPMTSLPQAKHIGACPQMVKYRHPAAPGFVAGVRAAPTALEGDLKGSGRSQRRTHPQPALFQRGAKASVLRPFLFPTQTKRMPCPAPGYWLFFAFTIYCPLPTPPKRYFPSVFVLVVATSRSSPALTANRPTKHPATAFPL